MITLCFTHILGKYAISNRFIATVLQVIFWLYVTLSIDITVFFAVVALISNLYLQ